MFSFTVQESVLIERDVETVFDFVADGENDIRWCPAVKEIERVSGVGGEPGAIYQMRHEPGGMSFDARIEVVSAQRPHRLEWVMTDRGHTIRGTYQLEPAENGTRLTQTSEVTFEGWLRIPGIVMKRFIARDVRSELRKQFDNLKRLLEKGVVRETA